MTTISASNADFPEDSWRFSTHSAQGITTAKSLPTGTLYVPHEHGCPLKDSVLRNGSSHHVLNTSTMECLPRDPGELKDSRRGAVVPESEGKTTMLQNLPGRIIRIDRDEFTIQGVYAAFPPVEDDVKTPDKHLRFSTDDNCCCEVEGEDRSRWLAEVRNDGARLLRRLD